MQMPRSMFPRWGILEVPAGGAAILGEAVALEAMNGLHLMAVRAQKEGTTPVVVAGFPPLATNVFQESLEE